MFTTEIAMEVTPNTKFYQAYLKDSDTGKPYWSAGWLVPSPDEAISIARKMLQLTQTPEGVLLQAEIRTYDLEGRGL